MTAIPFNDDVQNFYDETKAAAAGGLTFEEGAKVFKDDRMVRRIQPEKKAIVMGWVAALLDMITPALPFPYSWGVALLRGAILKYGSGQVEANYELLKGQTATKPS